MGRIASGCWPEGTTLLGFRVWGLGFRGYGLQTGYNFGKQGVFSRQLLDKIILNALLANSCPCLQSGRTDPESHTSSPRPRSPQHRRSSHHLQTNPVADTCKKWLLSLLVPCPLSLSLVLGRTYRCQIECGLCEEKGVSSVVEPWERSREGNSMTARSIVWLSACLVLISSGIST